MPSDRDLAQQLAAELDAWMVRCGGHIQLNNDLLAQHLVAWLSSAGRLVPEGSEVEWRCAELGGFGNAGRSAESGLRHHAAVSGHPIESRIVGPWTPAEPAPDES